MFTVLILLSRFLFVFFVSVFLIQAFFFVAAERGYELAEGSIPIDEIAAMRLQRILIVLMHVTAYLILAWHPQDAMFDKNILTTGTLILGFFIMAWSLTALVYRNSCPLIWNCIFFLMDSGIIMLQRTNAEAAVRQLMWFVVGLGLMIIIPLFFKIVPRFEKLEIIYLIAGFVLILSPFLIGTYQYGAIRSINFFGFAFQPSEAVKFLLVFYLASVFRKKQSLVSLSVPAGASALFVAILVGQRDLGGALILFMTFMVMLYIATGNHWLSLAGFSLAAIASVIAHGLFSHVRVRVIAWLDPFSDTAGAGYQIAQSLFAIGTWGILGSGLTLGAPESIPIVESDFIFAAICEEMGGIFAVGMIAVMIVILYRGMHIALRAERRYYSLLAAGFSSILAFQSILILGGVIKLVPLTGVTLPYVSYGGSSIVVCLLMAGILQWIYSYYHELDDDME